MSGFLIHLVCGSTGAGKTTVTLALADRLGALRFSIDEWMAALFWPDAPDPIDPDWAIARVERCYDQIWTVALRAAALGTPSILDLGFTTRESRDRFAALATEAGLAAQLHFVDVPADQRWRRVEHRNAYPGATGQLGFAVTREMFDFVERMWEPPTEDEMAALSGVRHGGGDDDLAKRPRQG